MKSAIDLLNSHSPLKLKLARTELIVAQI